jgi:hypothetical protein
MDDNKSLLEFQDNTVKDLANLLESDIEFSDVNMHEDGVKLKSRDNLKISHYTLDILKPKVTEDLKHISVHLDRLGPEGSKKSKKGQRLCHACLKTEEAEKSFRYCGQCKVFSYCR